jgi:hypothetical protein
MSSATAESVRSRSREQLLQAGGGVTRPSVAPSALSTDRRMASWCGAACRGFFLGMLDSGLVGGGLVGGLGGLFAALGGARAGLRAIRPPRQ